MSEIKDVISGMVFSDEYGKPFVSYNIIYIDEFEAHYDSDGDLVTVAPIPLTEQIMTDWFGGLPFNGISYLPNQWEKGVYSYGITIGGGVYGYSVEVKYVNQLQALLFGLQLKWRVEI